MKLTGSLKYPTIERIEEIKKTMTHKYICAGYTLPKSNTALLTLNYPQDITLHKADTAFREFMDALTDEVGLGSNAIAWFGIILERNTDGRRWPHMHLVVHSKRSRKTGRTVASLPIHRIKKLQRLWAQLVSWKDDSRPMDIRRVHDVAYLANSYLVGPDNLQAPYQRYRLVEHNTKLLHGKAARALMQRELRR